MLVDLIEPILGDVVVVSFDGEYDKTNGTYQGPGTAVLDNNCNYEGKFHNGLFHGKGTFTWPSGVRFEGDFYLGIMNGRGQYSWQDGSTYDGEIKEGKRHGNGKFIGASGQIYEGEWQNGMRNGQGKIWYNEEKTSYYSGEWKDNKRHGYGIMKYLSGNTYEGEWVEDKKCGNGVMIWKDLDEIYTGNWYEGKPHGYGEHIWGENGTKTIKKQVCNIYRGDFYQGQRHGFGTFFYMDGSQYTGEWHHDKKQGDGVFIHPNGKLFAGEFEDNRIMYLPNAEELHHRATEDINPQYQLNIDDILDNDIVGGNSMTNIQKTKEIERLLLKYNHCVKQLYRRYCDISVRRRAKDQIITNNSSSHPNLLQLAQQQYLETLPKVQKTIITARNIYKRLFCMSLDQMLRFMREIDLVSGSSSFRCYDFKRCLRKMRDHYDILSVNKLYDYKIQKLTIIQQRELAHVVPTTPNTAVDINESNNNNILPEIKLSSELLDKLNNITILPIIDSYYEVRAKDEDFDLLSSQPILEREFVELLIRCFAEAHERGLDDSKLSLCQSVYKSLAEILQARIADWESKISTFNKAFYHDSIIDLLQNYTICNASNNEVISPFEYLWLQLSLSANIKPSEYNKRGGSIQVRHLVLYFLKYKGTILSVDVTMEQLVQLFTTNTTSNNNGDNNENKVKDFSAIHCRIDYDDFLELLMKLVLSDLWVVNNRNNNNDNIVVDPSVENNNEASNEAKESGEVKVNAEQALHEVAKDRLCLWFQNFTW